MTDNQTSSAREALVRELLAAIEANTSIARGGTSFTREWRVMDRDCAGRVREAADALRESVSTESGSFTAAGRGSWQALVQELLAAIEANKPIEAGSGLSPYVPTFDRHDREAEYQRPGWELVDEDSAKRVEKAAAALIEVLRDGV